MIRVLILGRPAATWSQRLLQVASDDLELETARLPAQGIRRFEELLPDALLLVDDTGGPRIRTLVQAIRNRPLGQLLPILLVCPDSRDASMETWRQLSIHQWLPPDSSPEEILVHLAGSLDLPATEILHPTLLQDLRNRGIDLGEIERAAQSGPLHPPRADEQEAFVVEDLGVAQSSEAPMPQLPRMDATPATHQPSLAERMERLDRSSLFPVKHSQKNAPEELDAQGIRRKLREVRHEDYYTILELRRGAEGPVIRQAYEHMHARFDPHQIDYDLAQQHFDELSEIQDAIEDAWAVLGDASLRDKYMQQTIG